ncbi:hypothetical protein M8818_004663 [Zalaria obscura]|uniref:Uncharacterized protein n=1 Tax=Zalaria obscura TaxID=2024903 RepID=A0ACC3SC93_9PEZI
MSQLEGPGKDDRFIMLGHAHDSPGAVVGKPSQDSGAQSSPKGISEVSTRAGLAHMQLSPAICISSPSALDSPSVGVLPSRGQGLTPAGLRFAAHSSTYPGCPTFAPP